MNCPKCGKEMLFGEIAYDQFSQGKPLLFWAPKEFYSKAYSEFSQQKENHPGRRHGNSRGKWSVA